ncbi:unnamed protein product [Polarella glacialis]|uniref:Uncharacterized protein n=2 Tax=Polarella glacialis TaxID=89957 RepID=A0A813HPX5_POLGL|nr:unnamed protein product [Polarella glacialis]
MAATHVMRSRKQGLPLMPCLCFGLAFVLFAVTMLSSALPEVGDGFVGASRQMPARQKTQLNVEGEWKPTIRDRGTPEYAAYMEKKGRTKRRDWEAASSRDPDMKRGGFGDDEASVMRGNNVVEERAPAPAPAPQRQSSPAPAPSGGGGGQIQEEGGNPFQFLIDLVMGTTTTTTTTPPPSPIESFFQAVQNAFSR